MVVDLISRMMPGKADCISMRDPTTGKKGEKTEKAFGNDSIRDYPDIDIGKSKFAALHPKWGFLSADMPRNVCGCKYHENIFLLLEALHQKYPDVVPLYSKEDFTAKCKCDVDNEERMTNNCDKCSGMALFNQRFRDVVKEDPTFKWYQWAEENSFIQKLAKHGSTTDAFEDLGKQLPKFFWHSFIKEKQAAAYNSSKSKAMQLDSPTCLLQMDFADNFTCQWQDEIQSAH